MLKKAASGVLAFLPYSRSARQKGCGLAGRTFLNIPLAADVDCPSGIYRLWKVKYSTGH
jgi:hypothetical protein